MQCVEFLKWIDRRQSNAWAGIGAFALGVYPINRPLSNGKKAIELIKKIDFSLIKMTLRFVVKYLFVVYT